VILKIQSTKEFEEKMKTFSTTALALAVFCATRAEVAAAAQKEFLGQKKSGGDDVDMDALTSSLTGLEIRSDDVKMHPSDSEGSLGSYASSNASTRASSSAGRDDMDVDEMTPAAAAPGCRNLSQAECRANAPRCEWKLCLPSAKCVPKTAKFAPQNLNAATAKAKAEAEESERKQKEAEKARAAHAKRVAEAAREPAEPDAPLKMAFECDAGAVQVHGLWLESQLRETLLGGEAGVAPGLTMASREAAWQRSSKSKSWLWKGSPGNQRTHQRHEWNAHGQYVVHKVHGFKNENPYDRYLELMDGFRRQVISRDVTSNSRTYAKYAADCLKYQTDKRQFFACGYMTAAGWNVHECIR